MKLITPKRILTGLVLAAAVMLPHHDAVASSGGTDILHILINTAMTNTGVDLNARGRVESSQNRQGKAYNQQLQVSVARLDPRTAYQLNAVVGEDTNSVAIAGFTTDRNGAFKIAFLKKAQGHMSRNQQLLPNELDPLCNVRELIILNGNTQAVLRADLVNPDHQQYLVKRSMNNPGFLPAAAAQLRIKSNTHTAQFWLHASGLSTNTDYLLLINGNVVQTNTTSIRGRMMLTALPLGSPDVLDIQTVALTDSTGTNVVLISGGLGTPCGTAAQSGVALGAAANFAVLAGSTVANTGLTIVNGDLGVSAGSAVTGFPPGIVNGNQHVADATAAQAQLDLTVAYNDLAGRTVAPVSVAGNLGGMTLAPGLYKSTSSLEVSSGDLTLDAKGDANGVFIFQIASTLTTTAGRQVILTGGAKAANVFWQVGTSATLGTTTVFKGNILADQAITLATGTTLEGRALARIAAVTLDANTVTIPAP